VLEFFPDAAQDSLMIPRVFHDQSEKSLSIPRLWSPCVYSYISCSHNQIQNAQFTSDNMCKIDMQDRYLSVVKWHKWCPHHYVWKQHLRNRTSKTVL